MTTSIQITLHIVSACCSKYFDNWIRFYQSVREKAPFSILHFYDLGISEAQHEYLKTLEKGGSFLRVYTFDFSKYPDWVHISKKPDSGRGRPNAFKMSC